MSMDVNTIIGIDLGTSTTEAERETGDDIELRWRGYYAFGGWSR